jgi:hypothetical protein
MASTKLGAFRDQRLVAFGKCDLARTKICLADGETNHSLQDNAQRYLLQHVRAVVANWQNVSVAHFEQPYDIAVAPVC